MALPRLKHFGWGREGESLTPTEEAFVLGRIEQRFGPATDGEVTPPLLEDIELAPPRLDPLASLPFCSTGRYDRVAHTYGKSFPDYVRGLIGDYRSAPDVVAYPRSEEEVAAVLDWAGSAQASVTPFGGGSSVVGGVEPISDAARYKGAVTIDLRELAALSRSIRSRARHSSKAARSARSWRHSSSLTGSRFVISRRVSSVRRSAAGSQRARAVILQRSIPTSMISSSRSASLLRRALSRRGGCRAQAPAQAPTG
jgi:hypothetical protein